MTDPDDWTSWLANNPPPCLQALVAHWRGYDRIPEAAWEEYTRALKRWETARMTRLYGSRSWSMAKDHQRKGSRSAEGGARRGQTGRKAPG